MVVLADAAADFAAGACLVVEIALYWRTINFDMKHFLLPLIFLFAGITAMAQPYNIVAKKGFRDMPFPLSKNKLFKMIGEPTDSVSRASERKKWISSGYNPDGELAFLLGFDKVYVFENNDRAIWKAYMKQGKAVYLNCARYGIDSAVAEQITVMNRLHFYDSFEKMKEVLGDNYVPLKNSTRDYVYLELGIYIIIDDGQVGNIIPFTPPAAKDIPIIRKKMIEADAAIKDDKKDGFKE
jgi:hypothetical protein